MRLLTTRVEVVQQGFQEFRVVYGFGVCVCWVLSFRVWT